MTDTPTTPPLRCLIVDDEAPARDELRYLLSEVGGVEVVGAAATATEALVLIGGVDYDVVFLDIRMPAMSGLELAAILRERALRPAVIFTTAHPDHAVEAFELSAVDYLLKPISTERLAASLDRVRAARRGAGSPNEMSTRPAPTTTGGGAGRPGGSSRLAVQRGERTTLIDPEQIIVASAARGYSYLLVGSERLLTSYSLAELEQRLSSSFFRVHRSYLVNLNHVVELRPDFRGGMVAVTDDPAATQVPVSRRQAAQLRQRLGLSSS